MCTYVEMYRDSYLRDGKTEQIQSYRTSTYPVYGTVQYLLYIGRCICCVMFVQLFPLARVPAGHKLCIGAYVVHVCMVALYEYAYIQI